MESGEDEDDVDLYYELFSSRLTDDEVFYFEDIEVIYSTDDDDDDDDDDAAGQGSCRTEVVFHYSYCNDNSYCFRPSLHVHSKVDTDKSCMSILFAIGMCVLPWCYLGYYTNKIVIRAAVITKCTLQGDMLSFWRHVYEQIIVEYCYINKLAYKYIELSLEMCQQQHCLCSNDTDDNEPNDDDNDDNEPSDDDTAGVLIHDRQAGDGKQDSLSPPLIVPIGGGKDSLVVWHLVKQQILQQRLNRTEHAHDTNHVEDITLLYVADGLQEYHHHRRLQRIIALTGASCRIVQHDFHYERIHRLRKSYLMPCAHPWAALVLFDALLVCECADTNIPSLIGASYINININSYVT